MGKPTVIRVITHFEKENHNLRETGEFFIMWKCAGGYQLIWCFEAGWSHPTTTLKTNDR